MVNNRLSYKKVIYESYELKQSVMEHDRLQKIEEKAAKMAATLERRKVNQKRNAQVFHERHPNYFHDYTAKVKATKQASNAAASV